MGLQLCKDAPVPENRLKRPRDANQLAKLMVDIATGAVEDKKASTGRATKDAYASELGRIGGRKGGKARAEALSPERRLEIARRAAAARWKK